MPDLELATLEEMCNELGRRYGHYIVLLERPAKAEETPIITMRRSMTSAAAVVGLMEIGVKIMLERFRDCADDGSDLTIEENDDDD